MYQRDGLTLAGILALVLASTHYLLPFRGEAVEWAHWVVLGAAVPASVMWVAGGPLPVPLARALAVLGAGAICWYAVRAQRWIALPFGAAQVVVAARLRREPVRPLDLVVAVGAWAAVGGIGRGAEGLGETLAVYLARWTPVPIGSLVVSLPTPARIGATVVAFLWVTASLALHDRLAARPVRALWRWLAIAVPLLVIALESLRVDYLFDEMSVHHWGVFTGPAQAVRQGGWLLWDTPATYGFLSTLALAATPTRSVWDGFFLWNALACAVSAGLLFWFLRKRMDPLLALLLALATVLWLPGARVLVKGGGVLATPNAGPFRFIWCQVLLAIAAFRPQRPIVLVLGTVLWLVGCLWSSESAAYCSATWLPALVLLAWQQPSRPRLALAALPPLLGLAAVAAISGYYWIRLGHAPDWYAFVEASIAVRGGVVALPINPWGAVAVLVLMAWAIAAVAVGALRSAPSPAAMAPLCAAFGLLWATSSYFVGRSHMVNVTNLLPGCCLVAAVILHERASTASGVRAALAALFAAVLLLAIHEPSGWWPRRPLAQRWALRVEPLRPVLSGEQLALMRRAGLEAGMPLVYHQVNVLEAWPLEGGERPPDTTWLPVTPFTELVPVPEPRRALYLDRFVNRTRSGGWLIEDVFTPNVSGGGPWFFEALRRHFTPGPQHQVGRWRATRYDYAGTSPRDAHR